MAKSTKYARRDYLAPDRYLSIEQVQRLRRTVKAAADGARRRGSNRALVNEMIVEVMLETGVRAEELCHLQLRDLPTHHGKDSILIRKGKGKVLRVIQVKPELRKKLSKFIKRCRPGAKPGSPLFVNEKGYRILFTKEWNNGVVTVRKENTAMLSYDSLYRKIIRVGRRAGISHLTPHMLRHTFATHLHAVEHDLRFVQDQLGHSKPETTSRYAKVFDDARLRQTKRLYV